MRVRASICRMPSVCWKEKEGRRWHFSVGMSLSSGWSVSRNIWSVRELSVRPFMVLFCWLSLPYKRKQVTWLFIFNTFIRTKIGNISYFSLTLYAKCVEYKSIMTTKTPLLGKTLNELKTIVQDLGMPKFTAGQIASWLYDKKVGSIEEMTNLSLKNRERLMENYEVGASAPVHEMRSVDGTVKYLFCTPEGDYIESVYIPDDDRATLCVSSQVGCKMNCKFCMTGKQGYTTSLTAAQILNQIYSVPERDTLTNVVFMGMGEPFDNLDEVLRALEILTADYGYKWSPKRITVSTVGLRKGLERFLEESDCHLAISLHSPFPSQRRELMPAEKAFSITEMVEILRRYDFSKQRRLSFEYIVFKGVNDSLVYAKELVKLLRGLDCRMNLIRFHAIPNVDLEGTDMESMIAFRDYLTQHGLFATIRASRGEDIFAACGMLSTAQQQAEKKEKESETF